MDPSSISGSGWYISWKLISLLLILYNYRFAHLTTASKLDSFKFLLEPFSSAQLKSPQTDQTGPILHKSNRTKRAHEYSKDFHCNIATSVRLNLSSIQGIVTHPLFFVTSYPSLSPSHLKYTLTISKLFELQTFSQAIQSEHLIPTMKAKLNALETNNTWYIWLTCLKEKLLLVASGSTESYTRLMSL